ncbi:MAG: YidH family protein [Gammaproteobacteria bacterium]
MVPHFSDHAANERTFLAWVRTVIALMAFGFLIEKFDLFLRYLAHAIHGRVGLSHAPLMHLVGEGIVALAMIMQLLASLRFFANRHAIIQSDEVPAHSGRSEILVTVLLIAMGALLLIFLAVTR